MQTNRYVIDIKGIVQGVGFRPFIFKLAVKNDLKGFVYNNRLGVKIEVQGTTLALKTFINEIKRTSPPLSKIVDLQIDKIALTENEDRFKIINSKDDSEKITAISPDFYVCNDCLKEMFNPDNKRFRYPFISCNNCGPRYTINFNTPYDRSLTSMSSFDMCVLCRSEYKDPSSRRFHSQIIACKKCGPSLQLLDNAGHFIKTDRPLSDLIELIKRGYIVAIKGIGGYHLVCDAVNEEAVKRLRIKKNRQEKPFAIMSANLDTIKHFAQISKTEADLISSKERPIVLIYKLPKNKIAPSVAPDNNFFGVMMPYTPIHHLIFSTSKFTTLVMTSANINDEPIVFEDKEIISRLCGIADYFLIHDRPIVLRCDDSVAMVLPDNTTSLIRRSRGFVPAPIFIKKTIPPLLACGSDLKNVFCLAKNDTIFPGPYIGNLANAEAYKSFHKSIEHYKKIFRIEPECVIVDKHPGYLNSQYGRRLNKQTIEVQHHHAHIASVMFENNINEEVIGLALDGTGYGGDGTIWGGEVFVCSYSDYRRAGYIKPLCLPGGNKAIKEPWRTAAGVMFRLLGDNFLDIHSEFVEKVGFNSVKQIVNMIKENINCPSSSGAGRLFDAAASILGVQHLNTFEGQAPIKFEMTADPSTTESFEYDIEKNGEINFDSTMTELIKWAVYKKDIHKASARFHNTVAMAFLESCNKVRKDTGLKKVCLGGGVFQNRFLLNRLSSLLREHSFEIFVPHKFPFNDGGIAIGQVAIATFEF